MQEGDSRPASSVLRSCCSGAGLALCPGTLFSAAWGGRRSQRPRPQVSLSSAPSGFPRWRPLSGARSRLGVRGQPGPLGPMHVSGRGMGAARGAFKYVPGPLSSGVGLTPRWSWCSDSGSSKPHSFCPAVPGLWQWGSPPPPGEDTAGTPGRGSGPTKSHVRELGGRPPSPVQPSLQRTSPGQNCDHSL